MITTQASLAAAMLIAAAVFLASCSSNPPEKGAPVSSDSSQYSIRTYVNGQISQLWDQPVTLYRIERDGATYDSTLLPITELDWKNVIPAFVSSDISAPAFTGQYRFSIADDDLTATRILSYEALRPDLYTRLFQISTDISNNLVRSIYIETRRSGFWKKSVQKLLYVPNRVVQVQETDNPLIGATRQHRLEYRFLSDGKEEQFVE